MFSASASKVSPIRWRRTSFAMLFTSSGITKALFLRNATAREAIAKLIDALFADLLNKYKSMISCVLFMGGEWEEEDLINKLKTAEDNGLNTCLYTGMEDVSDEIKNHLTWLKTGPWIAELGGLDSPETNQKFIEVKTNKLLNHYFVKP